MQALERSKTAALRESLRLLHLVVAEVDTKLRYVWIDNPHPDFDPASIIGKRDDEIIPPAEAASIMEFKQDVLRQAVPMKRVLGFQRSDGWHFYCIFAYPLCDSNGTIEGLFTVGIDTPGILSGILPICSYCKKIRDDRASGRSRRSISANAQKRSSVTVFVRTARQYITAGTYPDCTQVPNQRSQATLDRTSDSRVMLQRKMNVKK